MTSTDLFSNFTPSSSSIDRRRQSALRTCKTSLELGLSGSHPLLQNRTCARRIHVWCFHPGLLALDFAAGLSWPSPQSFTYWGHRWDSSHVFSLFSPSSIPLLHHSQNNCCRVDQTGQCPSIKTTLFRHILPLQNRLLEMPNTKGID